MIYRRVSLLAGLPFVLCLLLAWTGPAAGTDLEPQPPQDFSEPAPPPSQWQFNFAPYAWMMGVNGSATVRGETTDVDASFIKIVEETDTLVALMGYFEARRGPLGLFADVVWVDLSLSGKLETQRNPIANLNVLLNLNAELGYTLTIVEAGAAYEVSRWEDEASFTALDILGAARYWNQSADLTLNVTATINLSEFGFRRSGSRAVARSDTLEWVDPVVGGRVRHKLASGALLALEGDIGGFGVGSDFSWQAVATYGFDVNCFGTPLRTVVGYRALGVDYSETGPYGKNGVDFILHGPLLGVNMRW